jgi:hypothetical protein
MSPWLLVGGLALLIVLILLEGKRQERRHGKASGMGGALMRAGVLELQSVLEPDKKVEIVLEEREEREQDGASELPPLP